MLTLGGGDDLLVGVVEAVVDVGFLLKERVKQAVIDAERNEFDVLAGDGTSGYRSVLLVKKVGKRGSVVFPAMSAG